MRRILFDTETTGLDPKDHRLVSIAAVEIVDDVLTGSFAHWHLNPERPSHPEALAVHGLADEYLATQPKFGEIKAELMGFLCMDALVIHNARFDRAFLTAELVRTHDVTKRWDPVTMVPPSLCTYNAAVRRRGMGKGRNTLDTLTKVYGVQNLRSNTGKHGALIDALTLFGVYRALKALPAAPLLQSMADHYLSKGFGVHHDRFTTPDSGSPAVPAPAQPDPANQSSPAGAGG